MGAGDLWNSLKNTASEKAHEAANAISSGADHVVHGVENAAGAVKDGVDHAISAEQHAADAAANKLKAAGNAASDWTKDKLDRLKQTFTGGPKGFFCLPCAFYRRTFKDYQAKQIRICSDGKKQTVQEVQRNPDGTYKVVGNVEPGADGRYFHDHVWNDPKPVNPPYNVPAPSLTHVNGIMVTPASGLEDAMMLQSLAHQKCAGKDGSGPGGTPSPGGGKPCAGCDCVLYTYSETLGFVSDLAQCAAGKVGGWEGKIGHSQAQTMRDAINNNGHVTISAHSRGSILTENGWDEVFDEYRDKYYDGAYASQKAIDAGKAARDANDPLVSNISDDMAEKLARSEAARQIAGQQAADTINAHVTVITAGNAVKPNPLEDGPRVVTQKPGHSGPADLITRLTGSTKGGDKQTIWVNTADEHDAAQARANQIAAATGDPDAAKLDTTNYHTFGQWYAGTVADQYCKN